MGLHIYVTNTRTKESREMNCLRNPFGLCSWAEQNYAYCMEREPPEEQSLWYVINHWCYATSEQVDKSLFLEVVKEHGRVLLQLDSAYFWFTESTFTQFIHPCQKIWFHADDETFMWSGFEGTVRYHFAGREHIGMPMHLLGSHCFGLSDFYHPNIHTLAFYQKWYAELIEFAELLQDPDAVYHCSN
jgi:hypothetical protein